MTTECLLSCTSLKIKTPEAAVHGCLYEEKGSRELTIQINGNLHVGLDGKIGTKDKVKSKPSVNILELNVSGNMTNYGKIVSSVETRIICDNLQSCLTCDVDTAQRGFCAFTSCHNLTPVATTSQRPRSKTLTSAVKEKNLLNVVSLLQAGSDVSERDACGRTALQLASSVCHQGQVERDIWCLLKWWDSRRGSISSDTLKFTAKGTIHDCSQMKAEKVFLDVNGNMIVEQYSIWTSGSITGVCDGYVYVIGQAKLVSFEDFTTKAMHTREDAVVTLAEGGKLTVLEEFYNESEWLTRKEYLCLSVGNYFQTENARMIASQPSNAILSLTINEANDLVPINGNYKGWFGVVEGYRVILQVKAPCKLLGSMSSTDVTILIFNNIGCSAGKTAVASLDIVGALKAQQGALVARKVNSRGFSNDPDIVVSGSVDAVGIRANGVYIQSGPGALVQVQSSQRHAFLSECRAGAISTLKNSHWKFYAKEDEDVFLVHCTRKWMHEGLVSFYRTGCSSELKTRVEVRVGTFINSGELEGIDDLQIEISSLMVNKQPVWAVGSIKVEGDGSIENHSRIECTRGHVKIGPLAGNLRNKGILLTDTTVNVQAAAINNKQGVVMSRTRAVCFSWSGRQRARLDGTVLTNASLAVNCVRSEVFEFDCCGGIELYPPSGKAPVFLIPRNGLNIRCHNGSVVMHSIFIEIEQLQFQSTLSCTYRDKLIFRQNATIRHITLELVPTGQTCCSTKIEGDETHSTESAPDFKVLMVDDGVCLETAKLKSQASSPSVVLSLRTEGSGKITCKRRITADGNLDAEAIISVASGSVIEAGLVLRVLCSCYCTVQPTICPSHSPAPSPDLDMIAGKAIVVSGRVETAGSDSLAAIRVKCYGGSVLISKTASIDLRHMELTTPSTHRIDIRGQIKITGSLLLMESGVMNLSNSSTTKCQRMYCLGSVHASAVPKTITLEGSLTVLDQMHCEADLFEQVESGNLVIHSSSENLVKAKEIKLSGNLNILGSGNVTFWAKEIIDTVALKARLFDDGSKTPDRTSLKNASCVVLKGRKLVSLDEHTTINLFKGQLLMESTDEEGGIILGGQIQGSISSEKPSRTSEISRQLLVAAKGYNITLTNTMVLEAMRNASLVAQNALVQMKDAKIHDCKDVHIDGKILQVKGTICSIHRGLRVKSWNALITGVIEKVVTTEMRCEFLFVNSGKVESSIMTLHAPVIANCRQSENNDNQAARPVIGGKDQHEVAVAGLLYVSIEGHIQARKVQVKTLLHCEFAGSASTTTRSPKIHTPSKLDRALRESMKPTDAGNFGSPGIPQQIAKQLSKKIPQFVLSLVSSSLLCQKTIDLVQKIKSAGVETFRLDDLLRAVNLIQEHSNTASVKTVSTASVETLREGVSTWEQVAGGPPANTVSPDACPQEGIWESSLFTCRCGPCVVETDGSFICRSRALRNEGMVRISKNFEAGSESLAYTPMRECAMTVAGTVSVDVSKRMDVQRIEASKILLKAVGKINACDLVTTGKVAIKGKDDAVIRKVGNKGKKGNLFAAVEKNLELTDVTAINVAIEAKQKVTLCDASATGGVYINGGNTILARSVRSQDDLRAVGQRDVRVEQANAANINLDARNSLQLLDSSAVNRADLTGGENVTVQNRKGHTEARYLTIGGCRIIVENVRVENVEIEAKGSALLKQVPASRRVHISGDGAVEASYVTCSENLTLTGKENVKADCVSAENIIIDAKNRAELQNSSAGQAILVKGGDLVTVQGVTQSSNLLVARGKTAHVVNVSSVKSIVIDTKGEAYLSAVSALDDISVIAGSKVTFYGGVNGNNVVVTGAADVMLKDMSGSATNLLIDAQQTVWVSGSFRSSTIGINGGHDVNIKEGTNSTNLVVTAGYNITAANVRADEVVIYAKREANLSSATVSRSVCISGGSKVEVKDVHGGPAQLVATGDGDVRVQDARDVKTIAVDAQKEAIVKSALGSQRSFVRGFSDVTVKNSSTKVGRIMATGQGVVNVESVNTENIIVDARLKASLKRSESLKNIYVTGGCEKLAVEAVKHSERLIVLGEGKVTVTDSKAKHMTINAKKELVVQGISASEASRMEGQGLIQVSDVQETPEMCITGEKSPTVEVNRAQVPNASLRTRGNLNVRDLQVLKRCCIDASVLSLCSSCLTATGVIDYNLLVLEGDCRIIVKGLSTGPETAVVPNAPIEARDFFCNLRPIDDPSKITGRHVILDGDIHRQIVAG